MEWRPPVARPAAQDRLVILECWVHQMVAVVARVATARVLLVVMVPWAGTEGAVSPPLYHSCGGNGAADEQDPSVEEPFYSRRDLIGSSEG
jgi:hypothetical protein